MRCSRKGMLMPGIENPSNRRVASLVNGAFKAAFISAKRLGLWRLGQGDEKPPRKILVIEEEPLGDVIMATAVFPYLKQRFPESRVSVMTGPWAGEILANNPHIDEVILYDCPWAMSGTLLAPGNLWRHVRFLFGYPALLRSIKQAGYDLAIDLRGDFRNILLLMAVPGIANRLSYGRTGGEYLLTRTAPFEPSMHEIEKNFALLSAIGVRAIDRTTMVFPSEENRRNVRKLLSDNGVSNDTLVVIHPGAGRTVRLWPAERYAAAADHLISKYGAKVFITGTKKESVLADSIIRAMAASGAVNTAGKISLLDMAALLERSRLLICPDTGIMHLAAAVSVPTVALFGPGNPGQIGGINTNIRYIDSGFPCRPCVQFGCERSDGRTSACMDAIKTEAVIPVIDEMMSL